MLPLSIPSLQRFINVLLDTHSLLRTLYKAEYDLLVCLSSKFCLGTPHRTPSLFGGDTPSNATRPCISSRTPAAAAGGSSYLNVSIGHGIPSRVNPSAFSAAAGAPSPDFALPPTPPTGQKPPNVPHLSLGSISSTGQAVSSPPRGAFGGNRVLATPGSPGAGPLLGAGGSPKASMAGNVRLQAAKDTSSWGSNTARSHGSDVGGCEAVASCYGGLTARGAGLGRCPGEGEAINAGGLGNALLGLLVDKLLKQGSSQGCAVPCTFVLQQLKGMEAQGQPLETQVQVSCGITPCVLCGFTFYYPSGWQCTSCWLKEGMVDRAPGVLCITQHKACSSLGMHGRELCDACAQTHTPGTLYLLCLCLEQTRGDNAVLI